MGTGIILYQSKYGATRKYAQWLQEMTGFACMETKGADIKEIMNYDTVILGGGVYASGIAGLSFIKKNINALQQKKLAVFCVGASPYAPEAYHQIRAMHFKDQLETIPLFYCRGAWDMASMSLADRTLCKMLQKAVAKQDPETYAPWQKALMCAGTEKCDWTDRAYLKALVNYIES